MIPPGWKLIEDKNVGSAARKRFLNVRAIRGFDCSLNAVSFE